MGSKSGKRGPDPGEGGREDLLTPERHAAFMEAIAIGCPERVAALSAMVDPGTASRWKTRGETADEDWENLKPADRKREEKYRNFYNDLRATKLRYVKANLAHVHAAKKKDWRAAKWLLGLAFDEFKETMRVQGGDPDKPVTFSLADQIRDAAAARVQKNGRAR